MKIKLNNENGMTYKGILLATLLQFTLGQFELHAFNKPTEGNITENCVDILKLIDNTKTYPEGFDDADVNMKSATSREFCPLT